MDAIEKRCIEVVAEKGWNINCSQNPEIIQDAFTDIMFVGSNEDTGGDYPPSIKATVIVEGRDPVSEEGYIDLGGKKLTFPLSLSLSDWNIREDFWWSSSF